MNNLLEPNSSYDQIDEYVKNVSAELKTIRDNNEYESIIKSIVQNVLHLGLETYNYTYCSNKLSRTFNESVVDSMQFLLKMFRDEEEKPIDRDSAFTIYYLLAYYYREYERIGSLKNLIYSYKGLFSDYGLCYQVDGRLLRRQNKCRDAYEKDAIALNKLQNKGIDNLGVKITMASTISVALENNEAFVSKEQYQEAIESVNEAIIIHCDYSKYWALRARLKMFYLQRQRDFSYEECKSDIEKIKKDLQNAISYEKENAIAIYATHVAEYKSYLRYADMVLAEKRVNNKLNEELQKAQKQIEQQFNDKELEIQDIEKRFAEIFALFVAVISVIITIINETSNSRTVLQTAFIIIIMNSSILSVYTSFIMLSRNRVEVKMMVVLILSILLIVTCVALARVFQI